jgi:hypothetical protein
MFAFIKIFHSRIAIFQYHAMIHLFIHIITYWGFAVIIMQIKQMNHRGPYRFKEEGERMLREENAGQIEGKQYHSAIPAPPEPSAFKNS